MSIHKGNAAQGFFMPGYVFYFKKYIIAGDIILKGANIINYRMKQAGVIVGSPTGGTTEMIVPAIKERKLRLIIPVELEKESTQDITRLSEYIKIPHKAVGQKIPELRFLEGELFT